MRIFFSVGEPSGDQHAAHLIAELRRRVPGCETVGLGGPLMEQAGCRLLFRMTDLAVMGIFGVIPMLLTFWRLHRRAKRSFDEARPDAVVLVDFPGFNWHVARAAKKRGIPVFYYMPPQLWAWAPWRIKKVRKFVDHILSGLKFERDWYAERGIDATYVGHPFFDEVADHPLDEAFIRERRVPPVAFSPPSPWGEGPGVRGALTAARSDHLASSSAPAGGERDRKTSPHPCPSPQGEGFRHDARVRNVGVLPGSRHLEVTRNGPALMQIMRNLASKHPDVTFRVACYKELHRTLLRRMYDELGADLRVEFCVGKTPEIVSLADCCLMVSGSVSLELLGRRTPAVVIYRGGPLLATLARWLLTCKYITLPNLLADRMVMPEFYYSGDDAPAVAEITDILDAWLSDPAALEAKRTEMADLANRTATTGATQRAAEAILIRLGTVKKAMAA